MLLAGAILITTVLEDQLAVAVALGFVSMTLARAVGGNLGRSLLAGGLWPDCRCVDCRVGGAADSGFGLEIYTHGTDQRGAQLDSPPR